MVVFKHIFHLLIKEKEKEKENRRDKHEKFLNNLLSESLVKL